MKISFSRSDGVEPSLPPYLNDVLPQHHQAQSGSHGVDQTGVWSTKAVVLFADTAAPRHPDELK